jgi:hypothetical protein
MPACGCWPSFVSHGGLFIVVCGWSALFAGGHLCSLAGRCGRAVMGSRWRWPPCRGCQCIGLRSWWLKK